MARGTGFILSAVSTRIDSPRNPTVLAAARLKDRRHREREGLFLVEGAREVERALAAGVAGQTLLLAPDLPGGADSRALADTASALGARVLELSSAAFGRLSMRQNPDGVALVAQRRDRDLAKVEEPLAGLVLVLDGLEKPGNLGALMRTADATGVSAVIVTGEGTDIENPNVIRASQGSVFAVPVHVATAAQAVERMKRDGIRIVATSPHADQPHWAADLTGDVAVILGTEAEGLPASSSRSADEVVTVPMRSRAADSLNVSVAGAVILYEALRQRSV